MPPTPITTTVSPISVSAATEPDPKPVVTPHDTSDAASSGVQSWILTSERSEATTYSENAHRGQRGVGGYPDAWALTIQHAAVYRTSFPCTKGSKAGRTASMTWARV
jgi:hypothetical protein